MSNRAVARCFLVAFISLKLATAACLPAAQASEKIQFQVSAGAHDRTNTPICVPNQVAPSLKDAVFATLINEAGETFNGQITAPSLLATPPADSGKIRANCTSCCRK